MNNREPDWRGGAVNLVVCWLKVCQCGRCAVCGNPMHCSVHGPAYGHPPGSKPWQHEYVPKLIHQAADDLSANGGSHGS